MNNGNTYNYSGNFAKGESSIGDVSIKQYQKSTDEKDISDDIQEILKELADKYKSFDENTKKEMLKIELNTKIKDSDFKNRFSRALNAGTDGLVKVFESNPFVSIPISVVKAWFSNDK
jgi:hypothetical protein